MDDEDEIVLPNSPLSEYLKTVGYEVEEFSESLKVKEKQKSFFGKASQFLKYCLQSLRNITGFCQRIFPKFLRNNILKLNPKEVHGILLSLTSSPLLLEDDRQFMKGLLEEEETEKYQQTASHNIKLYLITADMILASTMILTDFHNMTKSVTLTIIFIAVTLCILLVLRKEWTFSRYVSLLQSTLQVLKEYKARSKKCVRIIQESEVVAHGFTLCSLNIPIQRLEMRTTLPSLCPTRQCPELRRNLFISFREMFFCWQNLTVKLIESIPIEGELDAFSKYLAFNHVGELGPLLQNDNEVDLEAVSDGFSLSSLKALTYFLDIQLSEFFRRLFLSLLPGINKHLFWNIRRAYPILQASLQESEPRSHQLHNTYQFYKSYQNALVTKELSKPEGAQSACSELQLTVHSLGLHLQAALVRIQAIEEQLESANKDENTSTPKPDVNRLLEEIQPELTACNSCLESAFSCLQVDRDQVQKLSDTTLTSAEVRKEPDTTPLPVCGDTEPIIVDEVFEALTNVKECENSDAFEDFEPCSREELAQKKASSATLVKELKNVLVYKAQEHKLRERKALERTGHLVEDDNEATAQENLPINEDFSQLSSSEPCSLEIKDENSSHSTTKEGGIPFTATDSQNLHESANKSHNFDEDVSKLHSSNFVSNIAFLAASKSKLFSVEVSTIGDDSDENEEDTEKF